MAWVFVRLKLALLRGGFSTSRASLVLYTIGTVVSIALGIAVGALLTGLFSKGTVTGAALASCCSRWYGSCGLSARC